MSKIKCIIEMDEDEYKRVKNAECSYDGFEKGTFGYYLNIIQKTATPITESDDCVSIQAVNEMLLKYAHSEEGKLFTEFLISQIKDLPPVLPKREQDVLDKIKDEIMKLDYDDYDRYEGTNISPMVCRDLVMEIIDNYRKVEE